ncbi:hypothetical protein QP918_03455 [Corynebacterium accolens]|nr:hypothetical protein [Corynebacterium accolens]MDK8674511.1 hypothetical protein [Corynebacterium accolens]
MSKQLLHRADVTARAVDASRVAVAQLMGSHALGKTCSDELTYSPCREMAVNLSGEDPPLPLGLDPPRQVRRKWDHPGMSSLAYHAQPLAGDVLSTHPGHLATPKPAVGHELNHECGPLIGPRKGGSDDIVTEWTRYPSRDPWGGDSVQDAGTLDTVHRAQQRLQAGVRRPPRRG